MKNVVILGSSGSIGENALRVAKALPEEFKIVGLAVSSNIERLLEQAEEFGVTNVAVSDDVMAERAGELAPDHLNVLKGLDGVTELAGMDDVDLVVCAIVGMAAIKPVLAAIEMGTDIALATKETLVAAGHIVKVACETSESSIIPVDSEHSAIFQCMARRQDQLSLNRDPELRKIFLTCSGGPFGMRPDIDLTKVSKTEVLNHPRWNMGAKITVDSASLMNKGLELIEARWLFDLSSDEIDIVIHPESIIHSMVEYVDGSTLAQLSVPDMRYAIQFAMTYPNRMDGNLPGMSLKDIASLNFYEPDLERFPALRLAKESINVAGTLPTVLNAANEEAVAMFLRDEIKFCNIWEIVEKVMESHKPIHDLTIEAVFDAEDWARAKAREIKVN
ncbi:MAG: 1-deoxy-D-xylulose-5-phosphate reductoisomerase [Kiritimatiellae bacterium]|jgi:1-deoxy-D-xylulose-5-phosphate reductoisomerase|nr:1-deoxy-D-xylulose-5-phosphate reductoisomerase [Kiritimatiellia bacterium]